MKKLLFFLLAIIFAIQGWSQTTLNEGFEGTSFPPDDWRIETTSGGGTWESSTSIAHGGTKSAKSGYYSGGCTRWLITPKLTVTATETNFSFWIACDNWYSDGDNIDVFVSTTDNSTSSFGTTALLALTEDSITTSWAQHTVDLSTFIGQDIYVAIRVTDNFGFNTFIDDVTGPELFVPACPKPTALSASNPTTSGVDLGWTDATGSIWNIQYMLNSETDWANATTITGVTNPYTFATLNGSTTYKARVQTDCGAELSEWSSPISFSTACDVITIFPWSEGFEGDWVSITAPGNRPAPNCWTVVDRGVEDSYSDYFWESNVDMSPSGTSHSGSRHAACYTDFGASDHNDWLISPMISLTGNERLRFWAMRANNSTGEPDEISVYISDDTFTTLDTTGMGQTGNMPGFTQIFTQALPVGDWVQYEINLNQHVGNKYIAFVRQGTPDGYVLRLDDVEVSTLPTCMRPMGVTASNITTTDAEIAWVNGSITDASWRIYYKTSSDTDYDSVQVYSNPYTLTGLSANTSYEIYVATDCGNEISEWSPSISFRTPCDYVITLPYIEDFDTYGTDSPANSYPACWSRNVTTYTSNYPYISSTNFSAPGSMYFYAYGDTRTVAVANPIDISIPVNSLMVEFKMRYSTLDNNGIQVGVMTDPDDFTTFVPVGSPQTISATNTWEDKMVMLTDYSGTGQYIALAAIAPAGEYARAYVDDFVVDYTPTCPDVYGLTVGVASTTSVNVSWDDSGDDGTGFNVAYASNVVGTFDPATSMIIPIPTGTTLPYIIPGFNPGDSVWVAVQRGCGGEWTPAQKATLPLSAIILPYYQDFENLAEVSEWVFTSSNSTITDMWNIGAATGNTGNSMYVSSDAGVTNSYTQVSTYTYATALVEFGEASEFGLTFDWKAVGESCCDKFSVYALPMSAPMPTSGYPTGGTTLLAPINQQSTWQNKSIILPSATFANTIQRLVFVWYSDISTITNPPSAVDNITITSTDCGTPTTLTVSNILTTSADVTWTEVGSATTWYLYYKPASSTTYDSILVSGTPTYSFTNLTASTSYNIYVIADCGSQLSNSSNVVNFQTACGILSVPTVVEGFNSVPPSTCWERKAGLLPSTGDASLTTTTSGWFLNSDVTATNAAVNIYSTTCNYWLITPSIDLGDGTSPAQIEFDAFYTAYSSTNPANTSGIDDRFAVVVSTDNGLTWNSANAFIWSNEASATRVLNSISNTPTRIIIPLIDPSTSLPYTDTIKIGFYGESTQSNADNNFHIDNFEVLPFATCQRPTSLGASAVSSTTANISFQENGNSTTWQYVLSDGLITDPDNGVAIITTDNPILLTNLIPQTQYTIWVRSDCTTEASIWSNPLTFVTEALPASVPYTFDFEDQTEALAWRNLSGSVNNWAIGQAAGNGPSSQNSGDNTATYISNDNGQSYAMSSGNIYAYTYRDIDFGTIPSSYSLSFDWKCQGYVSGTSAYSGLIVFLRDITDTLNPTGYPNNVNDNLGLFAQQSTWQTEQLPLDNVSGVKRLIFFYFDQYYNNTPPAAIDNISIVAETCPRPFDVTVSDATTTTAEVSWNHPGADSYIVSYRENTTGTTLTDIAAPASPIIIQGLTLGTQYLVAIKAICSGDTTIYSETVTFTTPCADGAISSFPWIEGFESGLSCWTQEFVVGTTSWTTTSSNNSAYAGSGFANFYNTAGEKTKLISPVLDISGLSSPYVSFWHMQEIWVSDQDELKVFYRASQDSAWTQLVHYTSSIANYQFDSLALPSPSSTYQIAFEGFGDWGYGVALDDITVYDANSNPCSPPTDLVVNALNTSASITWTPSGSEVSWEVKLNSGGTPEIVGSPSKTFTGLTPNTNYTAFVRSNCGDGTSSAWISAPFTTSNVQTPPVVSTTVPNAQITQTTAVFNASFVQGSDPILTRGFDYKIATDANWTNVNVTDETNPFTYAATGLIANTQYLVRGFVSTATEGVVVGDTATFTTLAIIPPTVTTDTVITNTDAASAVFQGTTSQGTDAIIARGFEYKLLADDWSTAIDLTASGSANITATVTGLSAVKYQVRAYAETLDGGKTYGDILDFNMSTSINSIDTDNLNVNLYPNPASNNTTLSIKGINGKVKISITDVQGRSISTIEREIANGEVNHSINLEAYAKGVYYIRIKSSNSIKTQKLIVQ